MDMGRWSVTWSDSPLDSVDYNLGLIIYRLVDNSTLKVVQETKDEPINDADVITYMLRGGFLFIQVINIQL